MRRTRARSRSTERRSNVDALCTDAVWVAPLLPDRHIPIVIRPRTDNSLSLLKSYCHEKRELLANLLAHTGAVLFRGWDVKTPQDFEDVILLLEPNLSTAYLGTSPRRSVTKYTFTASELPRLFPIPQHLEMSFLPKSRPEKLFFSCLRAPQTGGETPITDMGLVYQDLDPEVRARFEEKGVMYCRNYVGPNQTKLDPWKLKRWDEIFETTDHAQVEKICAVDDVKVDWRENNTLRLTNVAPAVSFHPVRNRPIWCNHAAVFHITTAAAEYVRIAKHTNRLLHWLMMLFLSLAIFVKRLFQNEMSQGMNAFYGDGSPIPNKDMEAVRNAVWKNSVIYKWERGDVIMLDNGAVSHGRMPYSGPRSVLVAWGGAQTVS